MKFSINFVSEDNKTTKKYGLIELDKDGVLYIALKLNDIKELFKKEIKDIEVKTS